MFVPILPDMFNHWFAQGAIPGSVTKGVITLLKKGGRHVWVGLDDYRPITLLNTELKTLAWVLANHLQLIISDLIGPEQTYVENGRSIQDNPHLICEVLEEIEDGTEAVLSNLDQSKAFDWVDHRFLASVLETAGFKLRDEGANPAQLSVPFAGPLTARVYAFADDITVRIPPPRYKGCEEGGCRVRKNSRSQGQFWQKKKFAVRYLVGSDTLPEPFRWSDGPVHILWVWFGPNL